MTFKEFGIECKSPSFISGWFIENEICDGMISFFNEDNYFPISEGLSSVGVVDKSKKESLDKSISPITKDHRVLSYLNSLSEVINLYVQKYNWCNVTEASWRITENFNIQYYPPNGGFKVFHFERNGNLKSLTRFLTFMTYLNDVDDGGETEFFYQKIKIKPKKGLTLIWPVDWTHTHRGIVSPTEEKMIVTGWYNFC